MTRHPSALFHEVQRVRQAKLGLVLLVVGAAMVAFMAWIMYQQLGQGEPFGSNPMPDSVLRGFGAIYVAIGVGMIYLFYAGKLVTEVRPDGIYVRFDPFHRGFKHFASADIAEFEARRYSAIREYGGWGLRYGPKGGAYNLYGNHGVQLVFINGKRLLIGSQQADAMVDAIRRAS